MEIKPDVGILDFSDSVIRRRVIEIERSCFDSDAWSPANFRSFLSRDRCYIAGATVGGFLLGYVAFSHTKRTTYVISLAVSPEFHRCGVGRSLLSALEMKLVPCGRKKIAIAVSEWLDGVHIFLRSCGWRAIRVENDSTGGVYVFERRINADTVLQSHG